MSTDPPGPVSESVLGGAAPTADGGVSAPGAKHLSGRVMPGEEIGSYRILELLGEGGMGEVYKAERHSPIRQTVAIKVVKLGMNSREIVRRFESERQALALMDHPGIARVLDAGTTPAGRPYFVMDFVAGVPITDFCDEHRLSIRDRLSLFAQVCDAIGHAHTKAIIHRDIKPSNVLAYLQDGVPAVKVIDFGIAKAIGGDRLTDQTFYTERGQAIGTYDSMSPEQADGSPDIDTRTDVYSLGVLLYELLTGTKPFDHATLAKAADAEIKRIIREVEPPKPSTRLSRLGEAGTVLADVRSAKLDALASQLRSELEWIPLKAIRKERARRYASPMQLAEDIRNYLDGRPLLAGPETRAYRARKFVARNRSAVFAGTALLLVAAASAAFYLHNIHAEQTRTRVALGESERQRTEAERQRAEAQRQAAVARDSSNFLANILRNADPEKSLGAEVTVAQALDRAVVSLDDPAESIEPLSEAMVRYVVGTTYRTLGRYKEAVPQLERARELDAKYRLPDDTQITATLGDLAWVYLNQGNTAGAEKLYLQVLELAKKTVPLDRLNVARTQLNLASVYKEQHRFEEAERFQIEALETRRALLKPDDPDVSSALNNLAQFYWITGRLDKAEPLVRETLKTRQATLPPGHPNIAQSLMNLGVVLRDQGKYAEAETPAREALEMRRKLLQPKHPDLAVTLDTLARIVQPLGRLDEAEQLFREALDIRKASLPERDPRIADSLYRLALVVTARQRPAEAETLLRDALSIQSARDRKAAPTTQTVGKLAALLRQTDRGQAAAALEAEYGLSSATRPSTLP